MKRRCNGEGSWGTKTINGTEYYRYTKVYHGKQKDFYGRKKADVKRKIKEYEESLNTSVFRDELQLESFGKYCMDWLQKEKYDKLAPKTYDSYEYVVKNFIQPCDIGILQLKVLNKTDAYEIASILNRLLKDMAKKFSKTYVNTAYTILSQVCRYGLYNNHISHNFMERVIKPCGNQIKPQKEKAVLDIEQVNKLWDEMLRKNTNTSFVQGKVGEYVYGLPSLVILFMCYTGLRSGEATALRWNNVNMEEDYIEINEQVVTVKNRNDDKEIAEDVHYKTITTKTKNKKMRVIPLVSKAKEILYMVKERFPNKDENGLVFSKTGKPISNSNLNRCLHNMIGRTDLPDNISIHSLRHSFASILLNEDNQSLYTVSDMLGHSSTDVTYKVYIDIFMKNKAKTLKFFDNIDNKNN